MSELPSGAPDHICQALVDVTRRNLRSDAMLLDEAIREVEKGKITEGDADRIVSGLGDATDAVNNELFKYCTQHCTRQVGGCAMEGFGQKLVGADYDTLSDEDKALYDFYASIMYSGMTTQMANGVFLG